MAVTREALTFGMAPSPLSAWYASPDSAESGLLLGVATAPTKNLAPICDRLLDVIRRFS
jgi:GntR family transcriptional regulator/MocR family aminotransferase